ncbi:MAG TPA: ferredoxin [Desulfosporosinus sp.]|nr:ferredoxin [Desulfosporosinus sp.]
MKGFVNKNACIGCGLCEVICPEVFELDEEGKVCTSEDEILERIVDSAYEAVEQCPVAAINVK